MLIRLIALVATALASAAQAAPPVPADWTSTLHRDHSLVGRIWSVDAEAYVVPDDLAAELAATRYVVAGETHDNPDHHVRQAWIVAAMAAAGRRPTVVFEMIPTDYAAKLDAHLATHPGDIDGLATALEWTQRGWPDFAMYRPIFAAASDADLPIAAGDISRDVLKRFRAEGLAALGPGESARIGLDLPITDAARETLKQDLRDGHCGLLPEPAVDAMLPIQRARDAALADAMLKAAETADGAVLIAGKGHARADIAVPWYLRARAAEATVLSVAMIEVADGETDPATYLPAAASYDYLWFTPATEREDQCEKLRERFGKK